MNAFKKRNAAIVLALMCFVFTSTTLNATTLAEAKEALAIYEARGDFETAAEIRQAIQKAEMSTSEKIAARTAANLRSIERLPTRAPAAPEETGIFDEAAYFLGFGEKAKREKQDKRITSCNAIAADYYQEKLEEAITDPSLWQLGGWESARDYANVDGFRRSCINR